MTAGKKESKGCKVISVTSYYGEASKESNVDLGANVRDRALALAYTEYGSKILSQYNDVKSSEIKLVIDG